MKRNIKDAHRGCRASWLNEVGGWMRWSKAFDPIETFASVIKQTASTTLMNAIARKSVKMFMWLTTGTESLGGDCARNGVNEIDRTGVPKCLEDVELHHQIKTRRNRKASARTPPNRTSAHNSCPYCPNRCVNTVGRIRGNGGAHGATLVFGTWLRTTNAVQPDIWKILFFEF